MNATIERTAKPAELGTQLEDYRARLQAALRNNPALAQYQSLHRRRTALKNEGGYATEIDHLDAQLAELKRGFSDEERELLP